MAWTNRLWCYFKKLRENTRHISLWRGVSPVCPLVMSERCDETSTRQTDVTREALVTSRREVKPLVTSHRRVWRQKKNGAWTPSRIHKQTTCNCKSAELRSWSCGQPSIVYVLWVRCDFDLMIFFEREVKEQEDGVVVGVGCPLADQLLPLISTEKVDAVAKSDVTLSKVQRGLCALRHGIQISMEAILACHPARSTEWLDFHPKWCELWRIRTGLIPRCRKGQSPTTLSEVDAVQGPTLSLSKKKIKILRESDSIGRASQRPRTRLDECPDPVGSRPAPDTFPDPWPASDSSRFARSVNLPACISSSVHRWPGSIKSSKGTSWASRGLFFYLAGAINLSELSRFCCCRLPPNFTFYMYVWENKTSSQLIFPLGHIEAEEKLNTIRFTATTGWFLLEHRSVGLPPCLQKLLGSCSC